VRLPNGHVLATFQWQGSKQPPGGLAELRRDGTPVRWARAAAPGVDSVQIQPYSLEVIPALDRAVTTSTSMTANVGVHVQVWRLSDLTLLHTIALPEAPEHAGHAAQAPGAGVAHDSTHHLFPGEPRLLADGRTVMLGTFTCGLYRLTGLEGAAPRLAFAHAVPRRRLRGAGPRRPLVGADRARAARTRRARRFRPGTPAGGLPSRVPGPATPHWLAVDSSGRRLVATSGAGEDPRVHLAVLNAATGALAPDPVTPMVDLSRVTVPGLGVVRAVPHGAVFGPGGR
jgi:hypothetical protein